MEFEHLNLYLAVLLGISESLALIPAFKSNGILSLLINLLKSLVKPQAEK